MRKLSAIVVTVGLVALACGQATTSEQPSSSVSPPASGESSQSPSATAASNTPITVWIDTTRQAAVDAFKAAHPDKASLIKEEIVDRGLLPGKVTLFNNIGSGWPDVVFGEPELVILVADSSRDFPLDLRPYVSKEILDGFFEGANAGCELPDGRLMCLRNDLAQNILWYNKPLMDQFGYEVPTTWEEYEALGERVAAEHPGYVIGHFGDQSGLEDFLRPSRCPTSQVTAPYTVYINVTAPECLRAAKLVDKLHALGVVTKTGAFDPAFIQLVNDDKFLMMEAASWFGEHVFGGKPDSTYYKESKNQLAVAMPLRWADEEHPWTGSGGGAAWTVSRHTANPGLATEFAIWVATANEYQATAPTFPAYEPAIDAWAQTLAGSNLYAFDPVPIMKQAAPFVDPLWGLVSYDRGNLFREVVIGKFLEGSTIEAALADWQEPLVKLAEASGYKVVSAP